MDNPYPGPQRLGCLKILHWSIFCGNELQGSHCSSDTKFHVISTLFPGKTNYIPGQFGFESVFVAIMYITKNCFVNILKVNLETLNLQITSFFPGFELKCQVFHTFWANSRPGKVNDKIPGFPGFPSSVGTSYVYVALFFFFVFCFFVVAHLPLFLIILTNCSHDLFLLSDGDHGKKWNLDIPSENNCLFCKPNFVIGMVCIEISNKMTLNNYNFNLHVCSGSLTSGEMGRVASNIPLQIANTNFDMLLMYDIV